MGINKILVQQRLLMLKQYIQQLESIADTDKEEFCQDKIKSAAAESYLRRALEVVFDIGRHILAKSGLPDLAMEYKSIARGLVEYNVVPEILGKKLIQMAGYRNRMVHLYYRVTEEELLEIISNDLDDFRVFVASIQHFLS